MRRSNIPNIWLKTIYVFYICKTLHGFVTTGSRKVEWNPLLYQGVLDLVKAEALYFSFTVLP